jgi:hypothetical protein
MSCRRSLLGCLRRLSRMSFRFQPASSSPRHNARRSSSALFLLLIFACGSLPLSAYDKGDKEKVAYGEGLIINIPLPVSEVQQVVEEVAGDGLIRGTKEYNKDQYVSGAKAADSSHVFPAWDQEGKVFYKVRDQAIDPRNFKDGNDVGTLAVRYVLQPQGKKNTVLRIDALFEEDFRHVVHESNGSVELAEYNDIREHLDSIEVMKGQDIEARRERQEKIAKKARAATTNDAPAPAMESSSSKPDAQRVDIEDVEKSPDPNSGNSATPVSTAQADQDSGPSLSSDGQAPAGQAPGQTLENRLQELRKQVERKVKSPGAPLKSAPFHTASTLVLLNPGAEVLIVISTPYWYGVETHDGQHGWMMRDQLEVP